MAEDEHRPGLLSGRKATLGCALLGCGKGALLYHLPSLARLPSVELVALADLDGKRLAQAARLAPEAEAFADWRAAIEYPHVQAVVVCLPNGLHAPSSRAALARGLHVYVEKPLATALEDADAVIDVWRTSGCIGMVGLNYRFNDLYRSARATLAGGRLGELVVRSVFTIPAAGVPAWKLGRAAGGGALLDLGSHHVDLVGWLLGEPVAEVSARISSQRSEDDTAFVELRLASGLVVHSLFAFGPPSEDRFGLRAGGHARRRSGAPQHRCRPASRRIEQGAACRLRPAARCRPLDAYSKRRAPGNEPSHGAALSCFADAVRTAAPARPDLADGRSCLAVLDAAERSARSGRPEAIEAGHESAVALDRRRLLPAGADDRAEPSLVRVSGLPGRDRRRRQLAGRADG